MNKNFKACFTMAEILISLTIIGIIAAITLPALQANINESAWKAKRKALYSRMSQAIEMLPSLNGYGEFQGEWADGVVTPTTDTAAERFISDGLSKVLKINNICDSTQLSKCGIPSKITTMQNEQGKTSKIDFPKKMSDLNQYITKTATTPYWNYANPQKNIDTKVAAFETTNGESVAVFYNPYCFGRDITPIVNSHTDLYDANVTIFFPWVCANFVYDLNGKKGPNKVGKDIGVITAMYPTDTIVASPSPAEKNAQNPTDSSLNYVPQNLAQQACIAQDKNSRVPTPEEAFVFMYNSNLYKLYITWTNKVSSNNLNDAYYVSQTGSIIAEGKGQQYQVRCVKR